MIFYMYRVCNIVERKLPGQLFHYRQFIFASRCIQRINFPYYLCKKQLQVYNCQLSTGYLIASIFFCYINRE